MTHSDSKAAEPHAIRQSLEDQHERRGDVHEGDVGPLFAKAMDRVLGKNMLQLQVEHLESAREKLLFEASTLGDAIKVILDAAGPVRVQLDRMIVWEHGQFARELEEIGSALAAEGLYEDTPGRPAAERYTRIGHAAKDLVIRTRSLRREQRIGRAVLQSLEDHPFVIPHAAEDAWGYGLVGTKALLHAIEKALTDDGAEVPA